MGERGPCRLAMRATAIVGLVAATAAAFVLNTGVAVAGESPCNSLNEGLREQSDISPATKAPYSLGLPECRAYEMVSPLAKQSHQVGITSAFQTPGRLVVTPEGNGVSWLAEGDFGEPLNEPGNFGSVDGPAEGYVSLLAPGAPAWKTSSNIVPEELVTKPFQTGPYGDLSPDFADQLECGESGSGEEQPHNAISCGRREHGVFSGAWQAWEGTPFFTDLTNEDFANSSGVAYEGASSDLSRAFMQIAKPILPGDHPGPGHSPGTDNSSPDSTAAIYEINHLTPTAANAKLRIVNIGDEGGKPHVLVHNNGFDVEHGQVEWIGPLLGDYAPKGEAVGTSYHAVSESGETVFFTATPEGSETETVFARIPCSFSKLTCETEWEHQPVEGRQTVKASDPGTEEGCAACEKKASTPQPATFQGAAADGSKVFFTTKQTLLNSDTTENLYEYDLRPTLPAFMHGERLVDLTTATGGETAKVLGIEQISPDGSHVYFIAKGVLTSVPNDENEEATPNDENLYGVDTETGEVKFIAVVSGLALGGSHESTTSSSHSQVTPDGADFAFSSTAVLAGDNNPNKGSAPEAAYRYDFPSGQLTWLSKHAQGFNVPGEGKSAWVADHYLAGQEESAFADVGDYDRAITGEADGAHDGEDVIFASPERLQEQDQSGKPQLYLWHCAAPCSNPEADGQVHMISDGQSTVEPTSETSHVSPGSIPTTAISQSGSDIFFDTSTRLVGQDTDELVDVYDARLNRCVNEELEVVGFPSEGEAGPCGGPEEALEPAGFPAPAAANGCSGEACQPQTTSNSPGSFGSATSSGLTPGGNLPPPGGGSLAFQTVKPKPLTNAQKLAAALKACKGKPKKKRAACETQAKKKYASKAKNKVKKSRAKKSKRSVGR